MSALTQQQKDQKRRSGSSNNKRHKSRKHLSYKKSRKVMVIDYAENNDGSDKMSLNVGKGSRRNARRARCPNAPHNTTSFLMNFHKSETKKRKSLRSFLDDIDDDDSIGKGVHAYGSFFLKTRPIPSDLLSVCSYSSR